MAKKLSEREIKVRALLLHSRARFARLKEQVAVLQYELMVCRASVMKAEQRAVELEEQLYDRNPEWRVIKEEFNDN